MTRTQRPVFPRSGRSETSAIWPLSGANPTSGALIARYRAGTHAVGRLYAPHEREGYPEQRAASICHRRWHERARQPHAQLSGTASDSEEAGRSSARQKKGWVKSAFGSKSHLRRSDKPADLWLALNPPKAAH